MSSAHRGHPPAADVLRSVLEDLISHDVSCAPHVVTRLFEVLGGDPVTIRDVAARLDPQQRQGLRPLPSPLPMVASIEVRYDSLELDQRDLELLVAVSLRLDRSVDPITAFDGRSAEEISTSRVGRHLIVRAGAVTFRDPLLAVWIGATTPPSVEARVHARLGALAEARGDLADAAWHRARSSLHCRPETAADLIRVARRLASAGGADRALLLAAEAVSHATGEDSDEARLLAGTASMAAGYAAEAAAWLASLFPDGAARSRLQGVGALLMAQAHLQGAVPDVDPGSFRPGSDKDEDWYAWAQAASFGAVLCAERGDRRGTRGWLQALREASVRVGAERVLRDPIVALTSLIAGESDREDAADSARFTGPMLAALRAATAGDIDAGLKVLAAGGSGIRGEADPFPAGWERSPIVSAYRAVVEVLLLVWRGDIGAARERLERAAFELPFAIPFAGLGVVLARRLDLGVLGRLGPVSLALTAAVPAGFRIDRFVDLGIQSYLAGSFDEASSYMRLSADREAPQPALSVPGLEEVSHEAPGSPAHRGRRTEPPEAALARQLMLRVAAIPDARWRTEGTATVDAARSLASPFARARVEAMLGIRAAIREEHAVGAAHLKAARTLFEAAGATAWARATDERLARLETEAGSALGVADPLAACRHAWEALLTAREVEVAMLVVSGASNRDIGESLNVSVRTVEVHLGRVFSKLEVRTRVELTVLAHRTGQLL